jgi:excisionase family DNA binding protein
MEAVMQVPVTSEKISPKRLDFSRPLPLLQALYPGSFTLTPAKPERQPQSPGEGLLTMEEAAAYIGVHVETLRKWVRLGKFPRIPLPGKGKDFRFSKAMIDEWARKRALGT